MTAHIVFEQDSVQHLQGLAGTDTNETCAAGLVFPAGHRGALPRYVVGQLHPVPAAAYTFRSSTSAQLAPSFCVELANRARTQGCGVAVVHTHPGADALQSFSGIDDHGERALSEYFERRVPNSFHVAAVFTKTGGQCRQLGSLSLAHVGVVGRELRFISSTQSTTPTTSANRFSRQVLAFGNAVQETLSTLRVAVVGIGGTGSVVATELAHLGVREFLLIDPDAVEESNLNRLVAATAHDVGVPKAKVFAARIGSINPLARCEVAVADVVDEKVAAQLQSCDVIFLCTDSHASRAIVNQVAYQYLIPAIDVGVAIHSRAGAVTDIVGRAQMLSSGLACLLCAGWIDSNQVRLEMMSEEQRRQDPYTPGVAVAQPAVISLNGTIASAAVTMFLAAVAAIPSEARMILYDAVRGAMRPTSLASHPECIVCSPRGARARGATWSLPTRRYVPI